MMLEMKMRHKQNLHRIKVGLRSILIVPTIFLLLLFFTSSSKTVFLVLWIISMFAIAIYLIAVEYNDYKLQANLNAYTMQETSETKSLMEENLEQNISALHDLLNRGDDSMSFLDLDSVSEDGSGGDGTDSLLTLSPEDENTETIISREEAEKQDFQSGQETLSLETPETSAADTVVEPEEHSDVDRMDTTLTILPEEESSDTSLPDEDPESAESGLNQGALSLETLVADPEDTSVESNDSVSSDAGSEAESSPPNRSTNTLSDIEFLMNTENEQDTLLNSEGENAQKNDAPIDADILEVEPESNSPEGISGTDSSETSTDFGFLSLDSSVQQDTLISGTGNSISYDYTNSMDTRLF